MERNQQLSPTELARRFTRPSQLGQATFVHPAYGERPLLQTPTMRIPWDCTQPRPNPFEEGKMQWELALLADPDSTDKECTSFVQYLEDLREAIAIHLVDTLQAKCGGHTSQEVLELVSPLIKETKYGPVLKLKIPFDPRTRRPKSPLNNEVSLQKDAEVKVVFEVVGVYMAPQCTKVSLTLHAHSIEQ
jgi:hypothetical protein